MNKANLSCEACYKFFEKQRRSTPCKTCPKPFLAVENFEVWDLFEDTCHQLRVGAMGGVLGFDYSALPFLLAVHQIREEDWYVTLKKLSVIYAVALPLWNKPKDPPKA